MSGNTSEVVIVAIRTRTMDVLLTVHTCESVNLFSEQGYYWKEAQIEVSKRIQAIRIRATTGMSGPKGDMAIDDVKVRFT